MANLDVAFETAVANGAEAFIWSSFLSFAGDTRVAALALSHHLVSLGAGGSAYPVAGGLMSYGPAQPAIYRRAGYYVDRILKGAKPAYLPVEFPTTYEMVVNQAAGLHQRIERRRAHEAEAAALELACEGYGLRDRRGYVRPRVGRRPVGRGCVSAHQHIER